jgi:hypothetical protein
MLLFRLMRSKPYGMMIHLCNTLVQKDTNPVSIAGVAKQVDAADLKSAGVMPRAGSSPATGTNA